LRAVLRGLHGRLLAALFLTSAVTLAVAAVTLLSPLDHRLRREEIRTLRDTAVTARSSFGELSGRDVRPGDHRLAALAERLEGRAEARVAVFDSRGRTLADTRPAAPFGPVPHSERVAARRQGEDGVVAMPVRIGEERVVVALRKPPDDARAAARDVRVAFTDAALAGLGTALLLGMGFATTLLRRLRRLRAAALEVAERGVYAEVPSDRGRDEVGDLSRAFSRMQSRLRQQERARRNFVATASHELRTPLASLQGMLELLERDLAIVPPDLADARGQTQRAQQQARRLNGLASDLLDLSRLDAEVELRSEPVQLRELCRAVVAEFELRAPAGRIELRHEQTDGPCWAMGDPGSVARVVRILVDNALRFSPPAEPVVVTVGRSGATPVIAVEDRGPGIPEEERELVFERFRRGSQPGADGGFGLGLAIGRELARRMGGELALTGPGARFELRLVAAGWALVGAD